MRSTTRRLRHPSAWPERRRMSQLSPSVVRGLQSQRRLTIALVLAATILLADQASKLWALRALPGSPIRLLSVLDLVFVRNFGVSFGMFNNGADANVIIFSLLAAAIVVALLVWLW